MVYVEKFKIKEIQRNKGLGEMSVDAFKYVLGRGSYTKISIKNLKAAKKMLEICFGKETSSRKALLMDGEGDYMHSSSFKGKKKRLVRK